MKFNKERHYGIFIKNEYFKEFSSVEDKILSMYKLMKEMDTSRLFFKIKKSKLKVVTVRIYRYKKKTEMVINTIITKENEVYDYADEYELFEEKIFLRKETRLYKHDSTKDLISEWID